MSQLIQNKEYAEQFDSADITVTDSQHNLFYVSKSVSNTTTKYCVFWMMVDVA